MFETTFLSLEILASLIGGLIAGLVCLVFLSEYKEAEETVKSFAEKLHLGKKASFIALSLLIALIYSLVVGTVRISGPMDQISLTSSIPYLLPVTIVYSVATFLVFWKIFGKENKEERKQWLLTSTIYGIILNLASGFLTFLFAMLAFFG